MARLPLSIVVTLLLVLGAAPANACIHGSSKDRTKPFKGRVLAQGYEGIVIHAQGREELILNVVASIEGDPKQAGSIGWVLALPAVPDRYDAKLSPQVFADASVLMHELTHPAKGPSRGGPLTFGGDAKGGSSGPAIKVKRIEVGPFTVHQIEVLGGKAVEALNAWFKANGFQERTPASMAFFVERRYTFLCLRVKPGAKQTQGFKKRSALPPLRVSFASKRPFFPLKFSSHAGTFPLSLYLATEQPLDWRGSARTLQQLGFKAPIGFAAGTRLNFEISPSSLGGELHRVYERAVKQGFPTSKRLFFNQLEATRVNTKARQISSWTDDVWFELNADPHRATVRKTIRSILGRRSLHQDRVDELRKLGAKAAPTLREVLVTSSNEAARISAAYLLVKLELKATGSCVELLKGKPSSTLSAALGAVLLGGGDARGFPPLLRGLTNKSRRSPLSWREGKPRVSDFCRGALAHFTGKRFNKPAQWQSWYSQSRKALRWDPSKRAFR